MFKLDCNQYNQPILLTPNGRYLGIMYASKYELSDANEINVFKEKNPDYNEFWIFDIHINQQEKEIELKKIKIIPNFTKYVGVDNIYSF